MSAGLSDGQVSEIYRVYGHLLLRRCRLRTRDDAAAEDALQEAFVKIMKHGNAYLTAESRLKWLYRVVDNCCYDGFARRREMPEAPDEIDDRLVPDNQPTDASARVDVERAFRRLRRSERAVAVLAFVGGLDQGQIARELGSSRQTVNKKLGTIRQRLMRWLHAG
jgi:RNA polymerase sigma-70 factor, ECF subfamily